METGDIIAFTTNKKGLDYSHIGFACRDEKNICRLLHASSKGNKVMIDKQLSDYISKIDSDTGITVAKVKI